VNRLHHLAILSRDIERLAAFYGSSFRLREVARHEDESGRLRSIWLDLAGPLLMIERTEADVTAPSPPSTGLLLFALQVSPAERRRIEAELGAGGVPIERRTAFTSYARDPDGNLFAFSHYPEPNRDGREDGER
jgi:catechol 2,3-dioxygenase-like lactoylglutathione lyase family enzyme